MASVTSDAMTPRNVKNLPPAALQGLLKLGSLSKNVTPIAAEDIKDAYKETFVSVDRQGRQIASFTAKTVADHLSLNRVVAALQNCAEFGFNNNFFSSRCSGASPTVTAFVYPPGSGFKRHADQAGIARCGKICLTVYGRRWIKFFYNKKLVFRILMGPGDWWCGLGVALGRNVDGQPSGWTHEVSPHNRAEPSVMLCITYRVDTKLQLTKGDAALTSPWSAHGRPFPIYEPSKLGCGYPQALGHHLREQQNAQAVFVWNQSRELGFSVGQVTVRLLLMRKADKTRYSALAVGVGRSYFSIPRQDYSRIDGISGAILSDDAHFPEGAKTLAKSNPRALGSVISMVMGWLTGHKFSSGELPEGYEYMYGGRKVERSEEGSHQACTYVLPAAARLNPNERRLGFKSLEHFLSFIRVQYERLAVPGSLASFFPRPDQQEGLGLDDPPVMLQERMRLTHQEEELAQGMAEDGGGDVEGLLPGHWSSKKRRSFKNGVNRRKRNRELQNNPDAKRQHNEASSAELALIRNFENASGDVSVASIVRSVNELEDRKLQWTEKMVKHRISGFLQQEEFPKLRQLLKKKGRNCTEEQKRRLELAKEKIMSAGDICSSGHLRHDEGFPSYIISYIILYFL